MWDSRMKLLSLAAPLTLGLVLGISVAAGMPGQIPKEPIQWSIKANLPDKPLKLGDPFTLQLTAKIDQGWHLYSTEQAEGGPTPTRIVLPSEQPFKQGGPIESSEPKTAMDPNFNLMTGYYEDKATFIIPVDVSLTASPGMAEAKVNVSFQSCNEHLCLPPRTVKLTVDVTLAK